MHSKNESWSWPLVDAAVDVVPIALQGLAHRAEDLILRSLQDPEDGAAHGSNIPLSISG